MSILLSSHEVHCIIVTVASSATLKKCLSTSASDRLSIANGITEVVEAHMMHERLV